MNRKSLTIISASIMALSWTAALADPLAGTVAPLPFVRPARPAPAVVPPVAPDIITGAIPRTSRIGDVSQLRDGLDALTARDTTRAIAIRDSLPQDSLDRHILTWTIAMSGQRDVPSRVILSARRELKDWPGLGTLRSNFERALYREKPSAADVIAALGSSTPETPEGKILLAQARLSTGNAAAAASLVRGLWTDETLDKAMEDNILSAFGSLLTSADHKARMDYLLYRNRPAQAQRFGDMGKAQSLYRAWSAVLQGSANAGKLLDTVDSSWKSDPGLLFARIEYLRRQLDYPAAAKLMVNAPRDAARLVNTTEWWNKRRIIARGLADTGDFRGAYAMAAGYTATRSVDIVDAEFHAGWYALRGLQQPAVAEKHFRKLLEASSQPVSMARAWYWLGRSAEAAGGDSRQWFSKAAAMPATFYGQLSAARIGVSKLNVAYPSPSAADRNNFAAREATRAMDRLEAAGHANRAAALYRALAQQIQSPGELAILSARAERNGNHQVSLQIGRTAFGRGIDAAALAFPVGVIPGSANISGSGKALAYAIARQESAFNPAAISSADARGLLQLLPGTAKAVAARHGIPWQQARLTSDPGYNATLGAHYLGEQIDAFNGSYILTFIAYNAGPGKVPEWLARYGDPRGKPIDEVVDWIERIPFPETRNYVQRVMENYQVYKSRLGQPVDIITDLRYGRQR